MLSALQGILLLKADRTPDGPDGAQKLTRLWVHEVYRVFYDRLVDDVDRATFFKMIKVSACDDVILDCAVLIN